MGRDVSTVRWGWGRVMYKVVGSEWGWGIELICMQLSSIHMLCAKVRSLLAAHPAAKH